MVLALVFKFEVVHGDGVAVLNAHLLQLLEEAGYGDGFSITINISDSEERKTLATMLQAYWQAIGVNAQISINEWGTFSDTVCSGNSDVYAMSWTWYPDPYFFLNKLFSEVETTASPTLGPIADRVLREQTCLEVCPSSNLQTGVADELSHHPVGPLHRLGFALALSSDNRLMSRTSTSREMLRVAQTFDWTLADLEHVVLTGLDNGFAPAALRESLRDEVVLPAFRAVRGAEPDA